MTFRPRWLRRGSRRGAGPTANVASGEISGTLVQSGPIEHFHLHAPPATPSGPPRGLPGWRPRMVNREADLAQLDAVLARSEREPGPLVAVLSGPPGVGKTATGLHWSAQVRERFDGGDLYADLAGLRHRGGVEVSDVLAGFLDSLGADSDVIPPTFPARQRLYASLTASRRMLVVLDDVRQAAEVTPLLPAGAGSVVLVTTTRSLEELFYHGATPVPLGVFDPATARRLLCEIAGVERVEADPPAADELISLCEGLPIALSVCAGRLAARRSLNVADVVARIADERERLAGLEGEAGHSTRLALDFAYADLDSGDARLYRRLGLHPGRDLAPAAAAVLAGIPAEQAAERMRSLCDAHLLEPPVEGLYRYHGLVRLHARECAERDDAHDMNDRASRALVDWYSEALRHADHALARERLRFAPSPTPDIPGLPALESPGDAFGWLEREQANLIAVLRDAADREWDEPVWHMSEALWLFYLHRKHMADWIESSELGLAAARRLAEPALEARFLCQLARAHAELGEHERAHSELLVAERAVEPTAHTQLQGSVQEFIAYVYAAGGAHDRALERSARARELFERGGHERGVALQDYHAGAVLTRKGEADAALVALERALEVMRRLGDQLNEARILLHLGRAYCAAADDDQAAVALGDAARLAAEGGALVTAAEAHEELAELAERAGRQDDLIAHRRRALAAYRVVGHPRADRLSALLGGDDAT